MKKRIALVLVIAILAGMCGCSVKGQEIRTASEQISETPEAVLTERQKKILEDNDLPTEYYELSISQKSAINAIEEMLTYLENKYEISFEYKEYIAPSGTEPEQLIACPAVGEYTHKYVTVTATKQGYQDDYIAVASTELFSSYLAQSMEELCPGIEVKVYSKITRMDLEAVPKDKKEFDGNVGSSVLLFADAASCTEDAFRQLKLDLESWMQQHELYGMVRMILLKQDAMQHVNDYNYADYLTEEYCSLDLDLSVQRK